MSYNILERFTMADGTKIQLEDWRECNSAEYPSLYGYTIALYPVAVNGNWLIRTGESFRCEMTYNNYANISNSDILEAWEELKNGARIEDLEHLITRPESLYYLGFEKGVL